MKTKLNLILVVGIIVITSCDSCYHSPDKPYIIEYHSHSGHQNDIECDSFQMIDDKNVFIWSDGVRMKIVTSNYISPKTNQCYEER